MTTKEQLKSAVCEAIDSRRDDIVGIGEEILRHPETGFNEFNTARRVTGQLEKLGLTTETGLAITGVKARMAGRNSGPTLAILGELDSLKVAGHPHADPTTGAAHACGHNAQIAGMLGAAMGLQAIDATRHLAGQLVFFAVPAEELIEIEQRMQLAAEHKIEFLLGKSELIAKGHFDDIDMAMMIHTVASNIGTRAMMVDSSNGAVVKQIRFIGKAAHAGGIPQHGINALNAANIALNAIAMQRETFWDKDTIRIHPIITKGGDAVSVVPAEVCIETFVRGASTEAILDANHKVDRCLRAGAMAIGAEVEIHTIPGYLPQRNNRAMGELFGGNIERLFGAGQFQLGGHRTGSTDMGDVAHIMPVIHPYVAAAEGVIHGDSWRLSEPEHAYVSPAKLLALTAIDLLYDEAAAARSILADFTPRMSRDAYLAYQRKLFAKQHYRPESG
jgi:amidohydrolase